MDNFMGEAIEQYDIGWYNMVEVRLSRSWLDIQGQYLSKKGHLRTSLGWAEGVVTGMLEMVHSQWKYRCKFLHKREEYVLLNNHHEWLIGQIQLQLEKGTERMEDYDYHLVWMTIQSYGQKGRLEK